jgi:uncharacterized membrane protein SpoIIM required for sporulation
MSDRVELLFSVIIVAVSGLHLGYGFRTGRILSRAWPVRRSESPVGFWFLMGLSALTLVAGLLLGLVGVPDRN